MATEKSDYWLFGQFFSTNWFKPLVCLCKNCITHLHLCFNAPNDDVNVMSKAFKVNKLEFIS